MADILKKTERATSVGFTGMAGFNLDDLAMRAKSNFDESEQQARQIVADASGKADQIRAQAREAGLGDALKDADEIIDQRVRMAVDEAVRSRMETLEKTVAKLWESEAQWLEQWQANTLEIAIGIAQKITQDAISGDPAIVVQWAEEAVESARSAKSLVVAVHPETLSVLGPQLDAVVRRPGLPEDTRIEPDESVEPMGVVVRQEGGDIDMQLSTQLKSLAERLNQG